MTVPKKITRSWLESKNACASGKEWCLSHGELSLKELYPIFMEHGKHNWFNWLIVRVMNKKQKVKYAIFAAELVLHVFEDKRPNDDRPRKAIKAAKVYLKNPCKRTKAAATDAAYAATDAADAAYAAADAAADAAYAAAYAADAAAYAYAATDAAYAAAYTGAAYAAAYTGAAARHDIYKKIFDYGMELLGLQEPTC